MVPDSKDRRPPGPEPETLKIEGEWEAAVHKALTKKPVKALLPPKKKPRRK